MAFAVRVRLGGVDRRVQVLDLELVPAARLQSQGGSRLGVGDHLAVVTRIRRKALPRGFRAHVAKIEVKTAGERLPAQLGSAPVGLFRIVQVLLVVAALEDVASAQGQRCAVVLGPDVDAGTVNPLVDFILLGAGRVRRVFGFVADRRPNLEGERGRPRGAGCSAQGDQSRF